MEVNGYKEVIKTEPSIEGEPADDEECEDTHIKIEIIAPSEKDSALLASMVQDGDKPSPIKMDMQCSKCPLLFSTKKSLNKHIKTHAMKCKYCSRRLAHKNEYNNHFEKSHTTSDQCPDGKSIECRICSENFETRRLLMLHVSRKHTGVFQFQCPFCEKSFAESRTFETHKRLHTGEKPFHCPVCERGFADKRTLQSHVKSHSSKFDCDLCGKSFKVKAKYNQHLKTHDENSPFKCEFCQKVLSSKYSLDIHMKIHASFPCKICGETFERRIQWQYHMNAHEGKSSYDCKICGKHFPVKWELNKHVLCHKIREKKFKCDICDAKLKSKKSLMLHVRAHTEEPQHKCPQCNRAFFKAYQLKDHMFVHTGEGGVKCPVCHKVLSNRSKMNVHLRIHLEVKPFKCEICEQTFAQKTTLTEHMLTHSPIKSVECPLCPEIKFKYKRSLRKHMRRHHSDELSNSCDTVDQQIKSGEKVTETKINSLKTKGSSNIKTVRQNITLNEDVNETTLVSKEKTKIVVKEESKSPKVKAAIVKTKYSEKSKIRMSGKKIVIANGQLKSKLQRNLAVKDSVKDKLKEVHIKTFKCNLCEKVFDSKSALVAHAKNHNAEIESKKRICQFCNEQFYTAAKYDAHIQTHMNTILEESAEIRNHSLANESRQMLIDHAIQIKQEPVDNSDESAGIFQMFDQETDVSSDVIQTVDAIKEENISEAHDYDGTVPYLTVVNVQANADITEGKSGVLVVHAQPVDPLVDEGQVSTPIIYGAPIDLQLDSTELHTLSERPIGTIERRPKYQDSPRGEEDNDEDNMPTLDNQEFERYVNEYRMNKKRRHSSTSGIPDSPQSQYAYPCDFCERELPTELGLARHMSSKHGISDKICGGSSKNQAKAIQCTICHKQFKNKSGLGGHMVLVHRSHIPNDNLDKIRMLQGDMHKMHGKSEKQIDNFPKLTSKKSSEYKKEKDLKSDNQSPNKSEVQSSSSDEQSMLKCTLCERQCTTKSGLTQHMNRSHCSPENSASVIRHDKTKDFTAERLNSNGEKSHRSEGQANDNEEASLICNICGRVCNSKSGLTQHMNVHDHGSRASINEISSPGKGNDYYYYYDTDNLQCTICGKQCSSKSGLTQHMNVHSNGSKNKIENFRLIKGLSNEDVQIQNARTDEVFNLKCSVCGKHCTSKSGLTQHMNFHAHGTRNSSTENSSSLKDLLNKNSLSSEASCSETENFQCNICGKQCSSKSGLTQHMNFHAHGTRNSSTENSSSLKGLSNKDGESSEGSCSETENFQCNICGKQCSSKSGLTQHLNFHTHGTRNSSTENSGPLKGILNKDSQSSEASCSDTENFQCNICGKQCSSKSGLTQHMNYHTHGSRNSVPENECESPRKRKKISNDDDEHTCEKEDSSDENDSEHDDNDDEVDLRCDTCGKLCLSKSGLTQHKNALNCKKEEKDDDLKCDICGKQCLSKRGLTQHKHAQNCHEVVSDDDLKCDICDKQCSSRRGLTQHKNAQNCSKKEEIDLTCDVCGKQCSSKSGLALHKNSQSCKEMVDSDDLRCDACGRQCTSKSGLTQHKNAQNCKEEVSDEDLRCDICDRQCLSKSGLTQHRNSQNCTPKSSPTKLNLGTGKLKISMGFIRNHKKIKTENIEPEVEESVSHETIDTSSPVIHFHPSVTLRSPSMWKENITGNMGSDQIKTNDTVRYGLDPGNDGTEQNEKRTSDVRNYDDDIVVRKDTGIVAKVMCDNIIEEKNGDTTYNDE